MEESMQQDKYVGSHCFTESLSNVDLRQLTHSKHCLPPIHSSGMPTLDMSVHVYRPLKIN